MRECSGAGETRQPGTDDADAAHPGTRPERLPAAAMPSWQ